MNKFHNPLTGKKCNVGTKFFHRTVYYYNNISAEMQLNKISLAISRCDYYMIKFFKDYVNLDKLNKDCIEQIFDKLNFELEDKKWRGEPDEQNLLKIKDAEEYFKTIKMIRDLLYDMFDVEK